LQTKQIEKDVSPSHFHLTNTKFSIRLRKLDLYGFGAFCRNKS